MAEKVRKAIILAGGRGTRLPAHEQGKAKALIEVGGRPILAHQIEQLKNQGFTDIRLALGHRADQVIEWLKESGQSDIAYVVEKEPLGTGGGIKLAAEGIKGPFLALFGDILADFNFRDIVSASMGGRYSVLAGVHVPDVSGLSVLEYDENSKVLAYKEKMAEGMPGFTNGNASLLFSEDFRGMPDKFSMEYDFFPKIISEGKMALHKHTGYWFDCGTEERLRRVREFFDNRHGSSV